MGDAILWAQNIPLAIPAGIIGIWLLVWWGALYPRVLVWLLGITLMTGQLVRLPLPGQGGGLLPSDIIACVVALTLGFRLLRQKIKPEMMVLSTLLVGYLIYALGRAFLGMGSFLSNQDFQIVFAYWLRLATYLLLIPLLMHAAQGNQSFASTVRKVFLTSVMCIALLGIIQLLFIPNLAALKLSGWDPHERRLVSTWLDPNLLGLLFVVAVPFTAALFVKTKEKKYASMLLVLVIALVGTASRSSFIAVASSVLGVCWLTTILYRRSLSSSVAGVLLMSQISIGLAMVLVILLFPARFRGLITSDATVSLRKEALSQAVTRLVEPHALTGVGYNAYQFAAQDEGLIGDFSIHSRSGTDNTLVTIWVTSGAIGLIVLGMAGTFGWLMTTQNRQPFVLWVTGSVIAAVFVHSQFVNSGLYGHIIIALALLTACLYSFKTSSEAYAH